MLQNTYTHEGYKIRLEMVNNTSNDYVKPSTVKMNIFDFKIFKYEDARNYTRKQNIHHLCIGTFC